jgi:chromosome segregation ATPase
MNILKKLFSKKVVDLDNDGKIESLQDEIKGLFSHFTTIKEELTKANEKLESVVKEEELAQEMELDRLERIKAEVERNIEKSKQVAEKANKTIESHKKLEEKVSEFIPN